MNDVRCSVFWSTFNQIFVVDSENACILKQSAYGRSGSSKVVGYDTNRMRVCDFLLVINSNLGLLLSCPVSEILLADSYQMQIRHCSNF